jgi:molybdate-binding protein/DNA-binding XRE family transcriptional regulator
MENHETTATIENNLASLRQERGLSVACLATTVGVGRQTLYAIEAGSYVPNTAVALRLARALQVSVEDLFTLPESSPPELPSDHVALLPGSDPPSPGQPVQLCRVDERLVASVPSPVQWYLPAYDAIVTSRSPIDRRKTRVQIYHPDGDFGSRILIAGCDPGMSVLARHLHSAGIELVLVHRNSSQALLLLKQGFVHIAGTHLRDEASGESNIPAIGRIFPKTAVAVISFAVWEEGIVTARGNPKGVRAIEDFVRKGVRIVNREEGSGSRLLLDSYLKRLKVDPKAVAGYEQLAPGHLPAAWQVQAGAADCCIATRAAARLFGLDFVSLVSERYDLVMRRQHLELPSIQALLDTLGQSRFRKELERIGGYDTRVSGQRML